MDSVSSPATVVRIGRFGGMGVPDLEGLWTRYEGLTEGFTRIVQADPEGAIPLFQRLYSTPIKRDLIFSRLAEIHPAGVPVTGALSSGHAQDLWKTVVGTGMDPFVICGTTVSTGHVSVFREPLNLKCFTYELGVSVLVGGAMTYTGALRLMYVDATDVLAGYGGGAAPVTRRTVEITAPMAVAIAGIVAARRDYLDESGKHCVHVIADGSVSTSGDLVKVVAYEVDTTMLGTTLVRAVEAPGRGWHWSPETWYGTPPRDGRVEVAAVGSLCDILGGPFHQASGLTNFMGALRHAMAVSGHLNLKELQQAELAVTV